jgi:uncharacterized membrane protein
MRWMTVGLLALSVVILGALTWAGYCAMTNGLFALFDYGRYTNMIWNSGHGDFYRCLVTGNYLSSHLSFSLALLGPLFFVWDDPFLLSVVQIWFLAAGGIVLLATGRRLGVPAVWVAGLLVWFVGYPYTQSVHLSEFHGVSANFVLVPWLYYCLHFARRMGWIPLLLILGLREEAGFMVVPLLLYHAVAHRWKGGYVMAGVALVYAVLAITVLYPVLLGHTIFAQHAGKSDLGSILASWSAANNGVRWRSLALIFLPALLLWRGGWRPLLAIPSLAVIITLCSAWPRQFGMLLQHPGPVVAVMSVAMLEAASVASRRDTGWKPARAAWGAAYLVLVTALVHGWQGFLPGTRNDNRMYSRPSSEGQQALWISRNVVPREGVLVTRQRMAAYVGNRSDLLTWDTMTSEHRVDVVFDVLDRLAAEKGVSVRAWLESGEFGVRYSDGYFVVLQRGADTNRNAQILGEWGLPVVHFAWTKMEGRGDNRCVERAGVVRHWERKAKRREPVLSYNDFARLVPGSYLAEFHLRANQPPEYAVDAWGMLRLYRLGTSQSLAEQAIQPTPAGGGFYHVQRIPFELKETLDVEPRVFGGDATLWLNRVVFRALPPPRPIEAETR